MQVKDEHNMEIILKLLINFIIKNEMLIWNFSISIVAGLITASIFHYLFVYKPYRDKKKTVLPIIDRYMIRLCFYIGALIHETFFISEDANKSRFYECLYNTFIQNTTIKEFFNNRQITKDNFLAEFYDKPSNEFNYILSRNNIEVKPITEEDFYIIIKDIKTDSNSNECYFVDYNSRKTNNITIKNFMRYRSEEILLLCNKLLNYSNFLSSKEIYFISEILDLQIFRTWFGPEANFSHNISMDLISHKKACYKAYLLSNEFDNYIRSKKNTLKKLEQKLNIFSFKG